MLFKRCIAKRPNGKPQGRQYKQWKPRWYCIYLVKPHQAQQPLQSHQTPPRPKYGFAFVGCPVKHVATQQGNAYKQKLGANYHNLQKSPKTNRQGA